jgi:hypothetical protein
MNSFSASGLTQQWIVVSDEFGTSLLVAKWLPDTETSPSLPLAA